MSAKPFVLFEDEYCHVVNNESGEIELIEGPTRFVMPPNKSLHGSSKKKKTVLKESQYVIVKNPCVVTEGGNRVVRYGQKQIRVGPSTFSLYPGEQYDGIKDSILLNKSQAAVIQAVQSFDDKKAGDLYMVFGPCSLVPKQYEEIVKTVDAINISENEAIYIRNLKTAELKLVRGPQSYMPAVDEELYYKKLTRLEYQALSMPEEASYRAYSIQIQKNEALCVLDYKNGRETIVVGPATHILGPYEGVKVLDLSAGCPKVENQHKCATINLGPDFMNDQFQVRTKDNAVLTVVVSYKWRFVVGDDLAKVFEGDFIGYACQSLRSRIREEASGHDFEKFHTNSSQILREKLFKDYNLTFARGKKQVTEAFRGRLFREFDFLVFELDVKSIAPVDKEIEQLLDESIKSSMKILCRKLNDNAETEAEKEKIESEEQIAKLKRNLIEIENANYAKERLEKTKIEGAALVEKAKAEREAEILLERSRIHVEVNAMKEQMELLDGKAGQMYIDYVKALALHKNVTSAVVVPADVKNLFLPNNTSSLDLN